MKSLFEICVHWYLDRLSDLVLVLDAHIGRMVARYDGENQALLCTRCKGDGLEPTIKWSDP